MTTFQMLLKLKHSQNKLVANKAIILLNKWPLSKIELEREKAMAGGFMKAVLNGDYESAISRADDSNKAALLSQNEFQWP